MPLQKINKITQAEMKSKGVSALANKPNSHSAQYGYSGLSATELKAWFDKIGVLLSSRLNDMIDMLAKAEACEHIAIPSALLPQQEGEISLLDFLKAFANGCMAHNIFVSKNEGSSTLQSLQSLLFEIDKNTSQNSEALNMISDLTTIVNQNAEMCSSNSKDAEGKIVSHKYILEKVEEVRGGLESDRILIPNFVENTVAMHNNSSTAHADIRNNAATALEKAQEAYNLAAGKSKVHPLLDFTEFVYYAKREPDRYNVGDVIMFANKLFPDFVVFAKNVSFDYGVDDYEITGETLDGTEELTPGKSFIIGSMRFITIESGMDVSQFVKANDFNLEKAFLESEIARIDSDIEEQKENLESQIDELESSVNTKEPIMPIVYDDTSNTIVLHDGNEYNLGLRLELTLDLPEDIGKEYEVILNFYAGNTETTLDAPSTIIFVGDDVLDGRLYPNKNRGYEVNIKRLWGALVARVGAFDYQIIEA